MKIAETGFEGLKVVHPDVFTDSRGYFFESYRHETFLKSGITFTPVQDNESKSVKGVIRGLHYQINPKAQAKLIRVVVGRIFDVAVDLRKDSGTFGKWFGIELDSESKIQLFIPKGFAHGFSVQSETAIIQYKCDNPYNPLYERGISLKDPALNIDWKTDPASAIISSKDMKHPSFDEAEKNF
jgi:dTDP-4-dehydrorhamnose 3,5-epimerase